jgi:hypothetical protein
MDVIPDAIQAWEDGKLVVIVLTPRFLSDG